MKSALLIFASVFSSYAFAGNTVGCILVGPQGAIRLTMNVASSANFSESTDGAYYLGLSSTTAGDTVSVVALVKTNKSRPSQIALPEFSLSDETERQVIDQALNGGIQLRCSTFQQ